MTSMSKRTRVVAIAGIAVSLAMTSGCTTSTAVVRPTSTAVVRPTSAANGGVSRSSTATSDDSIYADGVYTATGQYGNLPSSIGVTVTLEDDVITAVEVTPHATNPTSLDLQRRFAAAVPAVVVGKPIDEVNVDRLAGSSATPAGFNAAIQQIKQQAR
jgi:uncharacterized protein with FMN-binding domain